MARTKRNISEKEKQAEFQRQLKFKLNSLKTDFENGKIDSFEHIHALIRPSVLSKQLHMGYESYTAKSKSPGDFSSNELVRMSELIDVDINLVLKFVFKMMKYKNKFKTGDPIRL